MNRATTLLLGQHDFRAFAVVGEPKPHYRCTISEACWEQRNQAVIRFHIRADRFLYRMVRLLVGTLVDIGLNRRPESDFSRLLTLTHNSETSPPAPAAGLSFVAAEYPAQQFLEDRASW